MHLKFIALVLLAVIQEVVVEPNSYGVRWHGDTYNHDINVTDTWEVHGAISRFQDQANPWLYGDKFPLSARLFNRYNVYYSSQTIPDEHLEHEFRCPTGQFITGYHVTNPVSSYFYGHRIYKIIYICTNRKTGETSHLDIYKNYFETGGRVLVQGEERKLDDKWTCAKGYGTSVTLTYFVENARRYLVEAWCYTMCCDEDDCHTTCHGLPYLDWPTVPKYSHQDQECIICRSGFGLCGVNAQLVRASMGTIEGFFLKYVCCVIKD